MSRVKGYVECEHECTRNARVVAMAEGPTNPVVHRCCGCHECKEGAL